MSAPEKTYSSLNARHKAKACGGACFYCTNERVVITPRVVGGTQTTPGYLNHEERKHAQKKGRVPLSAPVKPS